MCQALCQAVLCAALCSSVLLCGVVWHDSCVSCRVVACSCVLLRVAQNVIYIRGVVLCRTLECSSYWCVLGGV